MEIRLNHLIGQAEVPEGDDVAVTCFDIILYNVALVCILYLYLFFLFASDLKGFAVYLKIANT